jgi:hypothetical protein
VSSKLSRRAVTLLVVAGLLLVAALLDRGGASVAAQRALAPGAGLPTRSPATSSWYCAEGTSDPKGRADETLYLANAGTSATHAVISVSTGNGRTPATRAVTVAPRTTITLPVSSIAVTPNPGVTVESTGGRLVVSHGVRADGDLAVGPCAPDVASSWHFAEGTTRQGIELTLALYNPLRQDAIVDISFLTPEGPQIPDHLQGVVIPARTQVTYSLDDQLGRQPLVSTEVLARRGSVVAEQSMAFDGTTGVRGIGLTLGAEEPSKVWYFPTGEQSSRVAQGFTIANPGNASANVTVQISLDGGAKVEPIHLNLPDHSAMPVDMGRVPPNIGYSVTITSDQPVTAETLITSTASRTNRARGAALSGGGDLPAQRWFVTPAPIGNGSDVVAVMNPGTGSAHLSASVLSAGTQRRLDLADHRVVGAGQRVRIDLVGMHVPAGSVVVISSDEPVVVDRLASSVPGLTLTPALPELTSS